MEDDLERYDLCAADEMDQCLFRMRVHGVNWLTHVILENP
jgi:hypothetical protein